MGEPAVTVLKGAMDVLILKALSWGPMHGYAVSRWIRTVTDSAFDIQEGALYPALHRLEAKRLIDSEWGLSGNNRQAKFYKLTAKGRKQLGVELSTWSRFATAVAKVVSATKTPKEALR
jgi:transcriptional regulator